MTNYIVATIKDWNIDAYHKNLENLSGQWHLITDQNSLTLETIEKINPRYIFFPHWSWMVPSEITEKFECVCFHMTDVPYGRGGSPLQNLIIRGHDETKITALRMIDEADAGDVYMKKDLSLRGKAQDIFERSALIVYDMIKEIVETEPVPQKQFGDITTFKRRTPCMSELPKDGELNKIYDHIRMLDADSYPNAFLENGDFYLSFTDAQKHDGFIEARVKIKKKDKA